MLFPSNNIKGFYKLIYTPPPPPPPPYFKNHLKDLEKKLVKTQKKNHQM
jgi:hypothetical protein